MRASSAPRLWAGVVPLRPLRGVVGAALALTPAATTLGAQAAPAPDRAALVRRLDSLGAAFVGDGAVAGATVGVVRGQDTLLLRGYGVADAGTGRRAGIGTVYRIGSITKQFTAAAVLQLVERGRLSLADTLGKFLPQYPQWARVTIRQLLNHTSGIPSYTDRPVWQSRMNAALAPDTVLGFVARDTLDFAPGTRFRYNNSGYFLLGQVLERVTGRPYAELVAERFFRPLGMRTAVYCPDAPRDTAYAAGYDLRGGTYAPTAPISMTSPYAAGALCMSVPDYLRWQAALTGGRVVTSATYARMSRSDTLADGRATGYGWGLAPASIGGRPAVAHSGGISGFSTQQVWLPQDSVRVVVFANTLGADVDRLAYNLAAAVVGAPLRPGLRPFVAAPLPPAVRDSAVGRFRLAFPNGPLPLDLRVNGDTLIAQAAGPGQGPIPLVYLGGDTFGAGFDPTLRLRLVREGGRAGARVTAVELQQGGGTFPGPRER